MRRVYPTNWSDIRRKLCAHAQSHGLSDPPLALDYGPFGFRERQQGWLKTIAWAKANGCSSIISEIRPEDYLYYDCPVGFGESQRFNWYVQWEDVVSARRAAADERRRALVCEAADRSDEPATERTSPWLLEFFQESRGRLCMNRGCQFCRGQQFDRALRIELAEVAGLPRHPLGSRSRSYLSHFLTGILLRELRTFDPRTSGNEGVLLTIADWCLTWSRETLSDSEIEIFLEGSWAGHVFKEVKAAEKRAQQEWERTRPERERLQRIEEERQRFYSPAQVALRHAQQRADRLADRLAKAELRREAFHKMAAEIRSTPASDAVFFALNCGWPIVAIPAEVMSRVALSGALSDDLQRLRAKILRTRRVWRRIRKAIEAELRRRGVS